MHLVKAGDVQKLTGLSAHQLREWTARRGLIEPDLKPSGPGSRARYAWQTVLLLRLAILLKRTFHVELQAHREMFAALAARLAKISFPALRGSALVLLGNGHFDIVPVEEVRSLEDDILAIRLDPHLDVLSTGFSLAEPDRQLALFPVAAVQ